MKFDNVVIDSFSYQDPAEFITSADLEERLAPLYERLNLPAGRLELQTGIQSRGIWPQGTRPSTIAAQAAFKCLEVTKLPKEQIDLLIYAGVCRDYLEPSTASNVHHLLGLGAHTQSFDLSNACLGFVHSMQLAAGMIEAGQIQTALIVTGENSGPLIEGTISRLNTDLSLTRKSIKPFIANLTIGSAAVAFLLTHKSLSKNKPKFLGGVNLSDCASVGLCQGDGNSHELMMQTDAEALLKAGIKLAGQTWQKYKDEFSWENHTADHIICHQVGIAHRVGLYQELELDLKKDFSTFEKYGNTGSAALPLTFCKFVEKTAVASGAKINLLGIGSGLHSIMCGVEWSYE
jgi:3-oxoacyl-[acyl-carrier-protein] synthase-3